jgi:hypothetical protein
MSLNITSLRLHLHVYLGPWTEDVCSYEGCVLSGKWQPAAGRPHAHSPELVVCMR